MSKIDLKDLQESLEEVHKGGYLSVAALEFHSEVILASAKAYLEEHKEEVVFRTVKASPIPSKIPEQEIERVVKDAANLTKSEGANEKLSFPTVDTTTSPAMEAINLYRAGGTLTNKLPTGKLYTREEMFEACKEVFNKNFDDKRGLYPWANFMEWFNEKYPI